MAFVGAKYLSPAMIDERKTFRFYNYPKGNKSNTYFRF